MKGPLSTVKNQEDLIARSSVKKFISSVKDLFLAQQAMLGVDRKDYEIDWFQLAN